MSTLPGRQIEAPTEIRINAQRENLQNHTCSTGMFSKPGSRKRGRVIKHTCTNKCAQCCAPQGKSGAAPSVAGRENTSCHIKSDNQVVLYFMFPLEDYFFCILAEEKNEEFKTSGQQLCLHSYECVHRLLNLTLFLLLRSYIGAHSSFIFQQHETFRVTSL